jgi:internalin A
MTVEMPMPDRPKRRWYQFRLFTMLVVVTVICVLMGLWVNEAHRQRDAVAAIKASGGEVEYEWDNRISPRCWFIDRLRPILGVDYVEDVSSVQILPDMPTLTRKGGPRGPTLITDGPTIDDVGMQYVGKLDGLVHLDLAWTDIGDAGVAHLKGLVGLRSLDLSKTNVSDAGLAHLKGLKWLRSIDLSKTRVTDAGMDDLQRALRYCMITGRRKDPSASDSADYKPSLVVDSFLEDKPEGEPK